MNPPVSDSSVLNVLIPVIGVVVTALASLLGVVVTQRAGRAATARQIAINEFQAQVGVRDQWITEMNARMTRLEDALQNERNYVDRLRDWIAAVALPALALSGRTYPPVPEYDEE